MKRDEVYQKLNSILIDKMKAGSVPWRKSWKDSLPPLNFVSKHFYQGINFLFLSSFHFPSPYYLTFLQCKNKGGYILKGSKGIPIVFWKLIDNDYFDPSHPGAEPRQIPYLRLSTAFNLSQTSLYEAEKDKQESLKRPDLEKFIASLNADIRNNSNDECAFYCNGDFITLPVISDFNDVNSYYASLFHELIHWTGSPKRLNRFDNHKPDKHEYSKEELVAELGASFLCGIFGINNDLDNSAAYLNNWLIKLSNDYTLFASASSKAKKACNYLLNNCNFKQIGAAA